MTPADLASLDGSALIARWRARSAGDWEEPGAVARLAERLLAVGEPLVAHDVIQEGLGRHPADVRLRELRALALARGGAPGRARAVLEKLRGEGSASEETLGVLARVHKDLAQQSPDPAERARHWQEAAVLYGAAYARSGRYWTGINTAATLLLTGERERARQVAQQVRAECLDALGSSAEHDRYWLQATLGEAALESTDWRERGLPPQLAFRIALHVGPVLGCVNPVTGRQDYLGTQVSRAARIEPVTPPGEVYATEEFAAYAALLRVSEFVCDYVGRVPLAKEFGSFPTYHVRRVHPSLAR